MVNLEENMTNLSDAKTQVTVGDSRTLTRTKCVNWHSYHKHDRKLYHVMLSNKYVILGLQENLFRVTRGLQKGFQVTSEGDTLILKKNSNKI